METTSIDPNLIFSIVNGIAWRLSQQNDSLVREMALPSAPENWIISTKERLKNWANLIHRTPIIAWQRSIFDAAMRGHEACLGTKFENLKIVRQVWILNHFYCETKIGKLRAALISPSEAGIEVFNLHFSNEDDLRISAHPFLKFGSMFTSETDEGIRTLYMMLLFLDQKLTGKQPLRLARPTRRRLEKSGITPPEMYSIIPLRRIESTSPVEHHTVDWSCRWIVNGHWRKQWHPSLGEHKLVYVHDHIKGPEDKPLKAPHRTMYAAVR